MKTLRTAHAELLSVPSDGRLSSFRTVLLEGACGPAQDAASARAFRDGLRRSGGIRDGTEGAGETERAMLFQLRGLLESGTDRVRSSFRLSEAAWNGEATGMLDLWFIAGMSDPDPAVRTNCGSGLAALAANGAGIRAAVPVLGKSLDDACAGVRKNSASALMVHYAASGDESGMEGLLNHKDADVRGAAARILGHISVS